jgi:hypothetical protein
MNALDMALAYAERGMAVFPCHYPVRHGVSLICTCGNPACSDAAKHPYGRHAPHGFHDASCDKKTIERWWGAGVPYNVGIAAGAVSGIVIIDVDPRHDGDKNLAQLEARHGALPPTWKVITGGGGTHLYFRHPGQPIPTNASSVAIGVDVRADGGYAIGPPSLHISGQRYAWEVDYHPEYVDLAPLPQWLLDKITGANADGKSKIDWKSFSPSK